MQHTGQLPILLNSSTHKQLANAGGSCRHPTQAMQHIPLRGRQQKAKMEEKMSEQVQGWLSLLIVTHSFTFLSNNKDCIHLKGP